jgi:hypothetical protein
MKLNLVAVVDIFASFVFVISTLSTLVYTWIVFTSPQLQTVQIYLYSAAAALVSTLYLYKRTKY